ncbi:MAG: ABC transporter permease [Puniceicoccaceae bacterium]
MIKLDIKPQPRLGLKELLGMTLTTQRHRIFRSLVTVLVVIVATAFLVNLSLSSIVTQDIWNESNRELSLLRADDHLKQEMVRLEAQFSGPGARRVLSGLMNTKLDDLDPGQAWFLFTDRKQIEAYNRLLGTMDGDDPKLEEAEILELAPRAVQVKRLEQTIIKVRESGLAEEGAGFRLGLLLSISLMVCVVGVANALLMSVTERSREIATLKCLGALDGSILSLFVLEASFIGLIGGLFGAVLGLILAGIRLLGGYGTYALGFLDIQLLAGVFIISIIMGMLLATFASVYPSLRAARLAPMEAMRVE